MEGTSLRTQDGTGGSVVGGGGEEGAGQGQVDVDMMVERIREHVDINRIRVRGGGGTILPTVMNMFMHIMKIINTAHQQIVFRSIVYILTTASVNFSTTRSKFCVHARDTQVHHPTYDLCAAAF